MDNAKVIALLAGHVAALRVRQTMLEARLVEAGISVPSQEEWEPAAIKHGLEFLNELAGPDQEPPQDE